MSYFDFFATSHEIPCGEFLTPPARIYPSYAAYMKSEDYRIHQSLTGSDVKPCFMEKGPDTPEKAVGSVHVYTGHKQYMCIKSLDNTSLKPEEEEFIRAQFTQPYQYACTGYYSNIFSHVSQFLNPRDKLEVLTIFLGHGSPLTKPKKFTIDLQDYADGHITLKELYKSVYVRPKNRIVDYIMPRTPLPASELSTTDTSNLICTIFPYVRGEAWDFVKLKAQGLL